MIFACARGIGPKELDTRGLISNSLDYEVDVLVADKVKCGIYDPQALVAISELVRFATRSRHVEETRFYCQSFFSQDSALFFDN